MKTKMKTIVFANLKEGWHKNFTNLTEKAHEVLEFVNRIYIYKVDNVEDAKKSIEDGLYVYLPPRYDVNLDKWDNFNDLYDFCDLVNTLSMRAIPLMVDMSDIEDIVVTTVPDSIYEEVTSVDYQNIRVNDFYAVAKMTNLAE